MLLYTILLYESKYDIIEQSYSVDVDVVVVDVRRCANASGIEPTFSKLLFSQ